MNEDFEMGEMAQNTFLSNMHQKSLGLPPDGMTYVIILAHSKTDPFCYEVYDISLGEYDTLHQVYLRKLEL